MTHQVYLNLLDKRLLAYPELYELLSDFIKSTNVVANFTKSSLTEPDIVKFLDNISLCDSKISILFSSFTGDAMRDLQKFLIDDLIDKKNCSPYNLKKAGEKARILEKALRSDILIYGVEFSNDKVLIKNPHLDAKFW